MVNQGTAVFGTSELASFFSPGVFLLVNRMMRLFGRILLKFLLFPHYFFLFLFS